MVVPPHHSLMTLSSKDVLNYLYGKMANMKTLFTALIIIFSTISTTSGASISFRLSAPSAVVKGENFQIQYILTNATVDTKDITFADHIANTTIIYGPAISQASTSQTINGKTSSTTSTTYTFTLLAEKEGTITIPSARLRHNGKTYTTNSTKIKVLPPDTKTPTGANTDGKFDPNELFVRAVVSSRTVYEQEIVTLKFRIYSRYNLRGIEDVQIPDLEGFTIVDETPQNIQLDMENYQGKNYLVFDAKQYTLYPQKIGRITIPPFHITIRADIDANIKNSLLPIFNGIQPKLSTPETHLTIKPLPSPKPATFANAVGRFSISSSISQTQIKAGETAQITLTVTGKGNTRYIASPTLHLPSEFDSSEPEIIADSTSLSKTILYSFTPKQQGKYSIPPIEFTYFDPQTAQYKNLKTEAYEIVVDGSLQSTQTGINFRDRTPKTMSDINDIISTPYQIIQQSDLLFGNSRFYGWYLIPILITVCIFTCQRLYARHNNNPAVLRNKRAKKQYHTHLKLAYNHLNSNNKVEFYQYLSRAVWEYFMYKMDITTSSLTKENLLRQLSKQNISETLKQQTIQLIQDIEQAQYAPQTDTSDMSQIYAHTQQVINKLEQELKP